MNSISVLVLTAAAALVLAYQTWVTVKLARADDLSRTQRIAQIAIVWLVPLIGGILCHWFYRLHGVYERPQELGYPKGDTYDGVEKSDVLHHIP